MVECQLRKLRGNSSRYWWRDDAPLAQVQKSTYTWYSYVVVVAVVVVLTLTRIIKSVVTGQAPVTVELRKYPREKHIQYDPKVVLYTQYLYPTGGAAVQLNFNTYLYGAVG